MSMMTLNSNEDVLWTGNRTVAVGGARRPLVLTVYKPSPPAASFKIVVSDAEDPCFLAHLMITRSDYEELKKLQGLLVDYDSFPMRFVKLIEQCVEHANMYISIQQSSTHVNLEIIEHNEFRKLIHLSLKMCLASDMELKKHMAENIVSLKRNVNELSTKLTHRESQLNETEKAYQDKIKHMNISIENITGDMQRLKIEHQEVLKREHEKYENEKFDWKKCAEMNVKTQMSSLQEALSRKDKQLDEASLRCKQMQEALKSLESQIIDKTQRILVLEQQIHTTRQDAEIWKNQNGALGKDFHEKDLNLQQTRNRLIDLEKILKEKSDLLRETLDSFQNIKRDKMQLEDKLRQDEMSLSENKQALKETNEQLLKANQIISKLNSDNLELKEKLMCRTAIALEQEKVIERYTADIKKLETKENEVLKELNEIKENFESLKKEHHVLKISVAEKDDIIKNNNSVIQWLHKKLDDPQPSIRNADSVYNSTPYMSVRTNSSENDNETTRSYQSRTTGRRSEPSMKLGLTDDNSDDQCTVDPVYLKPLSSTRQNISKAKSTGIQNGVKGNTTRSKVASNPPKEKLQPALKGSLASAYFPKS